MLARTRLAIYDRPQALAEKSINSTARGSCRESALNAVHSRGPSRNNSKYLTLCVRTYLLVTYVIRREISARDSLHEARQP